MGRFCVYREVLLMFVLFSAGFGEDVFHEQLLLKPLPSGKVQMHFEFTVHSDIDFRRKSDFVHFNFFPRSLGQLISAYSVQELHLSLTQGLWRTEDWGYPVRSAPPGAEVYAWFSAVENADDHWQGLTNGLSGLLCASLNLVTGVVTSRPEFALQPEGLSQGNHSSRLRYASLPREAVCTENLTPFKKLLPCSDKAGIAQLLQAKGVMDGNYRSLGLHLRPVCKVAGETECTDVVMEMTLSLTLVLDLLSFRKNPDWSLKALFGRPLSGKCALANISRVMVDVTENQTFYSALLSPKQYATEVVTGDQNRTLAIFNLRQGRSLNVAWHYLNQVTYAKQSKPVCFMERFATGYGEQDGGIAVRLHNTDTKRWLSVVYMETILWYFRIFLHTLKATVNGEPFDPWRNLTYHAALDRTAPHLLEFGFELSPSSVLELRIEFDKAFLKWNEFPPDAHHGFYVSSGLARVVSTHFANTTVLPPLPHCFSMPQRAFSKSAIIHSPPLLITLPTPDFSMPYNVICLSCTIVAIAFGSLHNLSIKRFTLKPVSTLPLKERLLKLFKRGSAQT